MSLERRRQAAFDQFRDHFPDNVPCSCRICRDLALNCQFAVKKEEEEEEEDDGSLNPSFCLEDEDPERTKTKKEEFSLSLSKNASENLEQWQKMLLEDKDFIDTIKSIDEHRHDMRSSMEESRKTLRLDRIAQGMAVVKEHRKWSKDVFCPKSQQIFVKSDADGDKGDKLMRKEFDNYLKFWNKVRRRHVLPPDAVYRDIWQVEEYDPFVIARENRRGTLRHRLFLDPMNLQERHFLEEARGLYLLDGGPEQGGVPPLVAMKPCLRFPYSYYAWKNRGRPRRGWVGLEDKLDRVPSVCQSKEEEDREMGNNRNTKNYTKYNF